MKAWQAIVPVAVLAALGLLGAVQLMRPDDDSFVAKADRAAPDRDFTVFGDENSVLNFSTPPGDGPVMVNLFASWCGPCRAEHGDITWLAQKHPEQVYGIAYKDQMQDTSAFLEEMGNPFTKIGVDLSGQGGLDFGLTGVPETFLISPEGKIILHVRGPLDAQLRDQVSAVLGE